MTVGTYSKKYLNVGNSNVTVITFSDSIIFSHYITADSTNAIINELPWHWHWL